MVFKKNAPSNISIYRFLYEILMKHVQIKNRKTQEKFDKNNTKLTEPRKTNDCCKHIALLIFLHDGVVPREKRNK